VRAEPNLGPPDVPTVELAGLPFGRLTRYEVVEHVARALDRGTGGWLLTANLDFLRYLATDRRARELFGEVDLVVADGMPLVWAARLQGHVLPDRVAGSDLVWLLAERAARDGRSIFLLGGNPGAAEEAARRLRERWPTLRIAGISSPWISGLPAPTELQELRATLERAAPDLVYVGLGMPKQEHLIHALRGSLPRSWWVGVGISLSFMSGEVRRAPLWMQRAGLEWLHRLAQEPRRLARRYLIDDVPFALRLLARSWLSRVRGRALPS